METKYVQNVVLAAELDKKVAFATIKIGDITITGITVSRSKNGRLRVFFPSWSFGSGRFVDSIEVPADLRSEIEAEVLAVYREYKSEFDRKAKLEKKQQILTSKAASL